MIQSILVYTLLAFTLSLLGWNVYRRESRLKLMNPDSELSFWSWEIVTSILLVTVMMGIRFNTGSDYAMYLDQYNHVKATGQFARADFEIGFYYITKLFAGLGIHYTLYFAFWALVQIFALYFGLRHHKHLLPWVGMVIILGPYAFNWLTFMRQWTIAMILVAIIPLIEQRKFIPYLLITALAITIHRSAWLLLLFYFLPYLKYKGDTNKWSLIIFGACVVLGIYPIWFKLFRFVPDLLDLIGYHKYGHHLVDVCNGQFRNIGWGPLHLISLASSLIFIYFYPQVKKHYSHDRLLPIFFILAFVGTCYENLMMNTYHSMLRPAEYIYVFIIIMIAYTVAFLADRKSYFKASICFAIPCLYVIVDIIKEGTKYVDSSLFYHLFFDV